MGEDRPPSFESINIDNSNQRVQEGAPYWKELLLGLLVNKRSKWNSYPSRKSTEQAQSDPSKAPDRSFNPLYLLTSIVMFRRASRSSNRSATDIGLYLEANGTKDRAITFLSRIGLCPSVSTIRTRKTEIRKYSEVDAIINRFCSD